MTEAWRVKRYYEPRITVPIAILNDTDLPDTLVCLSGPEVALLRTLLGYAHRRITWVSEYHTDHYLTPTTEEWDVIQAMTAELEDRLMTACCDDIVTALQAINSTLESHGTTLAQMQVSLSDVATSIPDIVTGLECLCAAQEALQIQITVSPDWPDYPQATDYFGWGSTAPDTTVGAQVDAEACALAQAWYQAGYEFMTEVLLPTMRFGFDKVLPAAAAALAAITGGVSIPAVIGVYALAELIQNLLDLAYDAAETNLENWILAHKEDIVCPLYFGLKNGGSGSGLWAPIQTDLVDPAPDLSAGDKLMVNFVFAYIALAGANVAKTQNSAWYQSVPVPGYCDVCQEPPIVGSNWIAIPYTGANKVRTLNHPAGSSWVGKCVDYDLPDGRVCCGMMLQVTDFVGNCDLKAVHGPNAGCAGTASFLPDNSYLMQNGWYYYCDQYNHDEDEVIATLAPGATKRPAWSNPNGTHTSFAWMMGWNCTGSATGTLHYLVYTGTTPP